MKSNFLHPLTLAAFGAAFSLFTGTSGAQAQGKTPNFATRSILVLSSPAITKALSARGLRVVKQYKNVGWSKVALAPGADVLKTVAALRAQGVSAEPDYAQHLQKTPNDPLYKSQWALDKISAPAAWNVTTGGKESVGGSDVVVAVLDSGIDRTHPDLKANLYVNSRERANNGKDDDGNGFVDDVNGYDFFGDSGNANVGIAHGTHVAGIIGAVGNNRQGISGVNWRIKLLSCRIGTGDLNPFTDDNGDPISEISSSTSAVISAMDYIIGLKKAGVNIRVANHSYGTYTYSQAEYAAFKRASDAGILNVCAAGNNGYDDDVASFYPVSFKLPGIVGVAATDEDDNLAVFSDTGFNRVALAAPGVDILSTLPKGVAQAGGLYGTLSGTSMAAPHVSGAAALLLAQSPTLSMQEVQSRLLASVDKLPQLKGKVKTGGRLNLAKLLVGNIYAVNGRVLRADGSAVSNVLVTLQGATAKDTFTTTTDAKGYYRFSALVAGRYTLSAKLSGFSFTAGANSPLSFTFAGSAYALTRNLLAKPIATTYRVYGTTYNAQGDILAGVEIYVDGSPKPVAISDKQGFYRIDDLVAGEYKLTARYREVDVLPVKSRQSVKDVQLPAKFGATAPDVKVDWQVPVIDTLAPTVKLTSPLMEQAYPLGQLQAITGNAYDDDLITALEFTLYRTTTESGLQVFYQPYDWTTGTFGDTFDSATPKVITVKNKQSVAFNVPLTDLPVGTYSLSVIARDRTLNAGGQFITFTVTDRTLPVPSPTETSYPRITFIYPYPDAVVRALKPFTANGTAHANNGVLSLNFYLQQVDDRGRNLGYYDWINERWVTEQDGTTTKTLTFNGGTDVKWSLPIPALPINRYVLHGYGIGLDGSQPPADGTLDDNVPFRAGTNPSPLPTATPSPSAASSNPSASGS